MGSVRNPNSGLVSTHPELMERSYAHWPEVVRVTDDLETLVTQVQAVDRHVTGRLVVQLDCRLDRLPYAWSEARLISRRSRARDRTWLVVRRPSRVDMVYSDDVLAIRLPGDLRLGDLLAIPRRDAAAIDALRRTQLT
jgi:hypothetical protein